MTDIVTVRCRMYKLLSNPSVRAATSYKISYRGSRALKVTMMTYKSDGKQIDVCLAAKKEEKVDVKIRNAGGGSYNLSSLAAIQRSVTWVCLHFRAEKCIDFPLLSHICKRAEHDSSICFPSRWLDWYAHTNAQYRKLNMCVVLHLHCTTLPTDVQTGWLELHGHVCKETALPGTASSSDKVCVCFCVCEEKMYTWTALTSGSTLKCIHIPHFKIYGPFKL